MRGLPFASGLVVGGGVDSDDPIDFLAMSAFLGLLGPTLAAPEGRYLQAGSRGNPSTTNCNVYGLGWVAAGIYRPTYSGAFSTSQNCCFWSETTVDDHVGLWLVRPAVGVPEPTTAALLTVGIFGVVQLKRPRKGPASKQLRVLRPEYSSSPMPNKASRPIHTVAASPINAGGVSSPFLTSQ